MGFCYVVTRYFFFLCRYGPELLFTFNERIAVFLRYFNKHSVTWMCYLMCSKAIFHDIADIGKAPF